MYCVNCGVKLADTEAKCPLCKTKAFHPDIEREEKKGIYPKNKYPIDESSTIGLAILATVLFWCLTLTDSTYISLRLCEMP